MYCVYVTTYYGDRLPKYYVGSSSKSRIDSGYKGSVSSKEYKDIWLDETLLHPEIFSTEIISLHPSREEALKAELQYQIDNDVVSSNLWINKSLAKKNGYFGRDVSGSSNPMYGKNRKGEKHKGGENISSSLQTFFSSEKSLNHRNKSKQRMLSDNPSYDPNIIENNKIKWKENNRNIGNKNGMFGKKGAMVGKKLYNDGIKTKAFNENCQPDGWIEGRHKKT